jgi:hypothetical protein
MPNLNFPRQTYGRSVVTIADLAIAIGGSLCIVAIIGALNIGFRRENKRRAGLSVEERKRIEHEDAVWSQRYGF